MESDLLCVEGFVVRFLTNSHSKTIPRLLARDRQILAFHGKTGARNGGLAILFRTPNPLPSQRTAGRM